jgi:UDP-N-acetylglucosamine--N-acetylmuramyl-(pentapeptide) pyrophosphoryl-undecaprenol N-acetylglucosamine transferase
MAPRVVIAGGGTGGHVFPALALAAELSARAPGCELLFVGSRGGLEERLVPAHGYRLELLEVGKLRGEGLARRLATLAGLPRAGVRALALLGRFAPDVVVGVGGYASGPLVLAAAARRIPTLLLEQNSVPGSTNRLLARVADRVLIAFRRAARWLPADRTLLVGNPLRPALVAQLRAPRTRAHDRVRPCLLILGGSQGAHALNELACGAAPLLAARLPGLRVIHQTGRADHDAVCRAYAAAGVDARVEPFIEEMAAAYSAADLALSRAGATTIAELCCAGVPAVLVPYPHAADEHQAWNAREIAERGGALALLQRELSPARLAELLAQLLADGERLARMGRAIGVCAYPDAAGAAAEQVREVATKGARS